MAFAVCDLNRPRKLTRERLALAGSPEIIGEPAFLIFVAGDLFEARVLGEGVDVAAQVLVAVLGVNRFPGFELEAAFEGADVHRLVILAHEVGLHGAEVDVVGAILVGAEVGESLDFGLVRAVASEGFESEGGDDPGGDGRGEVLAEEGAERNVLPLLEIAGGPVVEESVTEDVLVSVSGLDGLTEGVTSTEVDGHFEFEIHSSAGTEDGRLAFDGAALTVGAADGGARDDDGRGASVVADGEVQPVFEEGRLVGAEHLANVGSVVAGDVEVSVVTDVAGEEHLDVLLSDEGGLLEGFVGLNGVVTAFLLEESSDGVTDSLPFVVGASHEVVHDGSLEGVGESVVGEGSAERTILSDEGLEGESEVTDGNADVVGAVGELGETPRQVFDGERMTRRIFNPRHNDLCFYFFI